MKIIIEKPKKSLELDFEGTVEELFTILQINSEEVIIAKNNELITEKEQLKNTDTIKIMSVISGG